MSEPRTEFAPCPICLVQGDSREKRVCATIGICADCVRCATASFAVDYRTAFDAGLRVPAETWATQPPPQGAA